MEQNTLTPNEEAILQESDFSMEGYDRPVRRARITIFIVAALVLASLYQVFPLNGDPARIVTMVVVALLAGIYVALGFWTHRKPYTALIVALILYCTDIASSAVIEPASIFKGIVFKIVIILALVSALGNARECQRMMKMAKEFQPTKQ